MGLRPSSQRLLSSRLFIFFTPSAEKKRGFALLYFAIFYFQLPLRWGSLCYIDFVFDKMILRPRGDLRFVNQTTNELKIPTANTNKIQIPRPEKTVPLFSDHPLGEANTTGTPTTKRKETEIKANNNN
eukprot:TRINITY_DN1969_c2_g2_i3.p2 TRINITY_DN1969_c2_g2~~TRINITY_DN1969_c2_g2_i3.p2  ORF type:complete len:128 (-),score=9.16 TRINITY_DN1969_c2_g2_i3:1275-1658(-)